MQYGEDTCPGAVKVASFMRAWDNGDVTGPLRSTARAGVWADAHKKAGVVLKNFGYKGMRHGCDCGTDQCKTDYQCVLDKLAGKPHGNC